MSLKFVYYFSLHISAFVGLIYYKRLRADFYRFFSLYLLIILILDTYTSKFYKLLTDDEFQMGVYARFYVNHLVIPFEFFFFSWFYNKRLQEYKSIIKAGVLIYLVVWLIEVINRFGTNYVSFFTYSYQIGSLLMMVFAMIYFIDMMKSDRIIDYYKERFFYISLGIILFYVGTLPSHVFMQELESSDSYLLRNLYDFVTYLLNSVMYLLFASSFIWGKRN